MNFVDGGLTSTDIPNANIIYGERVFIILNLTPCSTKFVQWVTLSPLRGKDDISLIGPFLF